ncbi:Imm1 family immunity protein [Actinokineospora sp. G85]|uniref:Imm1 family immunity protein n=1 Tax=Actinokineospora sp. G85 TaxID=3406626 RepID=UPI003C759A7E
MDTLIDRVRVESPENAPILMQMYPTDDENGDGAEFGVGIRDDRGVLWYSGPGAPMGVYSTGEGPCVDYELAYFYANTWTGFPSNAEIPLNEIRRAFKEHLQTGVRPSGIKWQSGPA